jgi:WD40 repeat protein
VLAAAWSPDGKRVVIASEEGAELRLADGSGAPVQLDRGNRVLSVIWSPSGDRVVTSSYKAARSRRARRGAAGAGELRVWNVGESGLWTPPEPLVLEAQVTVIAMAFLKDEKALWTAGADNSTRVWTIDPAALLEALGHASQDCLPARLRFAYLGEEAARADSEYMKCEQGYGRAPLSAGGEEP